jgi:hypothetical protein
MASVKFTQSLKALSPSPVTLSGMTIFVTPVQLLKTAIPILVNSFGSLISVIPLQPLKATSATTFSPICSQRKELL